MRVVKRILLFLLVLLVLLQLIRPAKNKSNAAAPDDISQVKAVPADVQAILQKACYDCHSMSEDVYALVKAFGGGQSLYHDYCPMYNDGKGALWLSETKAINNPYFGKEMPHCGNVEEMIK